MMRFFFFLYKIWLLYKIDEMRENNWLTTIHVFELDYYVLFVDKVDVFNLVNLYMYVISFYLCIYTGTCNVWIFLLIAIHVYIWT